MKTYKEINQKIADENCVVVTAEEIIQMVDELGEEETAKEVDVVTTGTFGPMCSSGIFLNFGHSDPPIKMNKAWLNNVPLYCGIAAVDVYLGATELQDNQASSYGGAHVIEDLVRGNEISLKATGYKTDCYPRTKIETVITMENINQAIMFNPRNAYQNYAVATNSSNKPLYTYLGKLLPKFGSANYSSAGQISPLLNDPLYHTIGIGTRILIGGGEGYVAWEGTQFKSDVPRTDQGVPIQPAGSLAVMGNLKNMDSEFIQARTIKNYGVSLAVGISVPIPILNREILKFAAIRDDEIYTTIYDYSHPVRDRPRLGEVNYDQLRSGYININGTEVQTKTLSNYKKAIKIAQKLKEEIKTGKFFLQEPIQHFSLDKTIKTLN